MHGQTLIVSANTQETEQRALPQAASDPERQQEPQHWHPSCQHHLPAFERHTMGRTGTRGTRKVESCPQTSPWDARREQLRAWVQDHRDAPIDAPRTNVPDAQRKCRRVVTDFLEQMCRVFASHLTHACGRSDERWAGESCGGDASGALCCAYFDQIAGAPDGTHL